MSLWLLLALGSAVFLGGYEVSRKAALHESESLLTLLLSSCGGWLALCLALLVARAWGPPGEMSFLVEPLELRGHGAVLAKAALVSASWMCAYTAIKHLPISVASPLRAIAPAFTVVGALILFQEQPTARQWLGIAIVFSGYVAFARLGRREGITFRSSRWVWLLIFGTLLGSLSGLYDKHLLQSLKLHPTTLQFWFCSYALLLQAVLVAVLRYRAGRLKDKFAWSWGAPLAGVLLILADQFYFRALAQQGALVSVVALVRRSSVLISFTLGAWLFQERWIARKAAALAVVVTGLLLIVSQG